MVPQAQRAAAPRRPADLVRLALPYVGLVVGAWATVAPYAGLGPDLDAEASRELADHVVPGVLVIVVSAVRLLRGRRQAAGGVFPLVAGFGVLLAGLWMTATHLPLVSQAGDGIVAGSVATWHTVPGVVVMALGAVWAAVHWSDAEEAPPPTPLDQPVDGSRS